MLNDVLQDLLEEGVQLLGEHLVLVLSAMLIASAIAIPGGLLLASNPRARRWALGLDSVGQTIPSLALFGFLIPIPFIGGIGQQPEHRESNQQPLRRRPRTHPERCPQGITLGQRQNTRVAQEGRTQLM